MGKDKAATEEALAWLLFHLLVARNYGDGELVQVGGEDLGERRFVPPRGDLQHRRDGQVGWCRQGPHLTLKVGWGTRLCVVDRFPI